MNAPHTPTSHEPEHESPSGGAAPPAAANPLVSPIELSVDPRTLPELAQVVDSMPALIHRTIIHSDDSFTMVAARGRLRLFQIPRVNVRIAPADLVQLVHADDLPVWAKVIAEARAGQRSDFDMILRMRTIDGDYRRFRSRSAIMLMTDGELRLDGFVFDVHDTARLADEVSVRERALDAFGHAFPDMTFRCVFHPDGTLTVLRHSDAGVRELGLNPVTVPIKVYDDLTHPDDLPGVLAARKRTLELLEPFEVRLRMRDKFGEYRWFQNVSRPTRLSGGDVLLQGVFLEIDRLRSAQDAIETRDKFIAGVVHAAPMLIYVYDVIDEINIFAGGQLAEQWGFEPAEFARMGPQVLPKLLHPDDLPVAAEHFKKLAAAPDGTVLSINYRLYDKQGQLRHIVGQNTVLSREPDGRARRVLGSAVDITDLKAAQLEREREQHRIRLLSDALPALVAYIDREGRYRFCNRAYGDWLGRDPERLVGATTRSVLGEERWAVIAPHFHRALTGERVTFQLGLCFVDGQIHEMDVTYIPDPSESPCPGVYVMAFDVTQRHQTEKELREFKLHLETLVAQRTDELQRSNAALREAERLASLGTLAEGLGHDIANLLLPVRCRIDALQADAAPRHRDDFAAIREGLTFLERLARGLLSMAHDPHRPSRAMSLADWWRTDGPALAGSLPPGAVLDVNLPAQLPRVCVESEMLNRSILNLFVNAAEAATSAGQVPHIKLSAEVPTTPASRFLRLTVADRGPGMPPEVLRRATEPYFTTRKRHLGTGLGLSLVRASILSVGGMMEVSSSPGEGTVVCLSLPVEEDGLHYRPTRNDDMSQSGRPKRTIHYFAVIMDDPRISSFLAQTLTNERRLFVISDGKSLKMPIDAILCSEAHLVGDSAVLQFSGANNIPIVGICPKKPVTSAPVLRIFPDVSDLAGISAALDQALSAENSAHEYVGTDDEGQDPRSQR